LTPPLRQTECLPVRKYTSGQVAESGGIKESVATNPPINSAFQGRPVIPRAWYKSTPVKLIAGAGVLGGLYSYEAYQNTKLFPNINSSVRQILNPS